MSGKENPTETEIAATCSSSTTFMKSKPESCDKFTDSGSDSWNNTKKDAQHLFVNNNISNNDGNDHDHLPDSTSNILLPKEIQSNIENKLKNKSIYVQQIKNDPLETIVNSSESDHLNENETSHLKNQKFDTDLQVNNIDNNNTVTEKTENTEKIEDDINSFDGPVIDINLNDIKTDYSEYNDFVIIFLYVSDVKQHNYKIGSKCFSLVFTINYNLFGDKIGTNHNENNEFIRHYTYYLNLNFKHEIVPVNSSCKVKKKSLEIRLEKKVEVMWGSIKEVCYSTTKPSSSSLSSSSAPLSSFSPNTWTPCTQSTSPTNNLALIKYDKDDVNNDNQQKFRGFTGLDNLGNTCFMNSVLQCLANTDPLRDYFLANKHINDINASNPLGMKGYMAKAFAQFLSQLWMGKQSSFGPNRIKSLLSKKVSWVGDSQQHDAQEFMSFLLDNIHEDLNQKTKSVNGNDEEDDENTLLDYDVNDCPLPEMKEQINKRLKEMADKSWNHYKLLNNSIITDLFCGQFKSILTCPECGKKSNIFDPFMSVALPIPPPKLTYQIIFFSRDEATDMCKGVTRISLEIAQNFTVQDLMDKLYDKGLIPNKDVRLIQQPEDENEPVKSFNNKWLLTDHYGVDEAHISNSHPLLLFQLPNDKTENEYVELCVIQREFHELLRHKKGLPFIACIKKSLLSYSHLCAVLCSYARFSVIAYRQASNNDVSSNQFRSNRFNVQSFTPKNLSKTKKDLLINNNTSNELPHLVYHKTKNIKEKDTIVPFLIHTFASNSQTKEINEITPAMVSINLDNDCDSNDSENENEIEDEEYYENFFFDNDQVFDLDDYFITMDWITTKHFPMLTFSVKLSSLDYDIHYKKLSSEDDDITLDDCLQSFIEPEYLGPQDCWCCPKCKALRNASKKLSFWRLPPILVIQLKRFKTTFCSITNEKINYPIKYPINGLDLGKYYSNFECVNDQGKKIEPIYDLYAVINHQGSPFWGHYTAFARSSHDKYGWRLFNDHSVEKIDEDRIVTPKAYILFYKRRVT